MKRYCENCKHYDLPLSEYPCYECNSKWSKWEPIAETKEEDMGEKTFTMTFTTDKINEETLRDITGDTTKIDTEAELRAQVAKLQEELAEAKEKNEAQRRMINGLNNELERKNGMVDGLKFAIRCNGVSGGEV